MQKALELRAFFPHARATFMALHPDYANLPDKTLPRLLFQRRRALRLTKRQVAERLGVHVEMVGKWERGENTPRAMYHPAIRAFIGDSAWDDAHADLPPLTRYRLKRGWSQAKLAAALGVSERSVGRWERSGTTLDEVSAISALQGLELDAQGPFTILNAQANKFLNVKNNGKPDKSNSLI